MRSNVRSFVVCSEEMLDSVVLAVKCTLYLNFVVTQSKKNFCECRKVYIGEAGRCMHKRIKEHDRDIRLSQTQTPAVSECANKTGHYPLWDHVKFIERDPHWYSRRVKEAIHVRFHPNNINRDSGIEIPEV